ncbi:MAG: cadherin-like domain-containing protein, partial [Gammaproteobacteria bacterium]|nr:cadherin-like domain-containing protein [Gammaproteobacteria bacterium]
VVSNDSDTDGSIVPSTVIIVSDVTNGSIINQLNGTVTYNPNSGFTGSDAFSYTVDDNNGASSNVATVSITINAVTGSNISINSTSQNGIPVSPVTEKPAPGQTGSGD